MLPLIAALLVGLLGTTVSAQGRTVIAFSSPKLTVGETATVEARLTCGIDSCAAFEITLTYDPRLLRVNAVALGTYLGDQALVARNGVDNDRGEVALAAVALGAVLPNADDLLFSMDVTALDAGRVQFRATSVEIGDLAPVTASIRGGVIEIRAPQPTVAPTVTPVPRITAAPNQPAAVTAHRPSTLNAGLDYRSVWTGLGFLDLTQPGTATYTLNVDAAETYRWVFTWCADTETLLNDALADLTVQFLIDDRPVTSILEYHVPRCHGWITLLSDWRANRTLTLDVRYALTTTVTIDGQPYSPGDYLQRITVNVR